MVTPACFLTPPIVCACCWLSCRTLDATELAADRCKLLKLESKIRYEQDRQQLQQQFSTRRSSKEAQALLAGSSSSTADGKPAAAAAAVAKPAWRQQLEQVAAVNLLRARRLVEKVVEAGMISLPSPFQVRAWGPRLQQHGLEWCR
jgi:hypothetical protein